MKQINLQSTGRLQKTLATLKKDFRAEQNQKDMEVANKVYKTLINQIEIELNSREDMRNYTYNILTNEIVIFEQEKEDENTFNCVGDIVIQLKKEGYKQVINILKN